MVSKFIDSQEKHAKFLASFKKHILMITNHGIHQWDVIPGLPDTGGQNVFVNQFTDTLAKLGLKITILNRGGYNHPQTGEPRGGLHYKDENQRILYLEDDKQEFVRKEDMDEQTPKLTGFLKKFLAEEKTGVDIIISHYWDGAKVGVLFNKTLPEKIKHIWVPHSVGTVKKRNVKEEQWPVIRVDERIEIEKQLLPELDGIAATSSIIRGALKEDYGYKTSLFLPPCVNPQRFYPQKITDAHEVWEYLAKQSGLSAKEIKQCTIITEISRTDTTKRKDLLIKAFAQAHKKFPDTFLIVAIDAHEEKLSSELKGLIAKLGVKNHVAAIGSVWDLLPAIYAVTDIYFTPSVMEGFGMAVQEAAATGVPVIASDLVPFVAEYLLTKEVKEVTYAGAEIPLRHGKAAIVVKADDLPGFSCALEIMLADKSLREEMGQEAYRITIPYFTWEHMVKQFLQDIGFNF